MTQKHCADCTHLDEHRNRCGIREVFVREPSHTTCANHADTEALISGPIFAFVEETRAGNITTHWLPYWRNRRPYTSRYKLYSSDTGIAVFDDGRADIRQFDSVSNYLDAYLDEHREWLTETIDIPVRKQIERLILEELIESEEFRSHGKLLIDAIHQTKEQQLGDYGWARWVQMLLECYFKCEYPNVGQDILQHQNVLTALQPFIAAARGSIPELREFKMKRECT